MTSPSFIAVHSSLPGEGATTIATNLAALLAMRGKRVCLLDLNFHFADATYILRGPGRDIGITTNDYLNGRCDIEQALKPIQHAAINEAGGALYFAPANSNAADMAKIYREDYDLNLLNTGIRDIAQGGMDYILLDTPPGIEENSILHIAIVDTLLLVSKPSRRGFQALSVMIGVAKKLDVSSIQILVNLMPEKFPETETAENYMQTFEAPVGGVIYRSDEVEAYYANLNIAPGFFALERSDHPFSQIVGKAAAGL